MKNLLQLTDIIEKIVEILGIEGVGSEAMLDSLYEDLQELRDSLGDEE